MHPKISNNYDLQKVLQVRYEENSEFFYKRKMAVYSLTITDLVSRAGYCYTSDQTISKRRSNEICSFLKRFIADNVEREITKITMFADNCPGQIKNRYIVQMLAIMSVKSKLSIIDLIFFEKGHTQNINDS